MRLGFDLGGTRLRAGLVAPDGRVVRRLERSTGRAMGPKAALDAMCGLAQALGGAPEAAGVGFPGAVDAPGGLARSTVMLDGWDEVPLGSLLSARLGVPCMLDNDVNAAALAEQAAREAARQRADDLVFVAVGTGIGGALVLNGRLRRGASGIAGEVGHVSVDWRSGPPCRCGRRGCLGALASGGALQAGQALDAAAAALGAGLASVINLLDPALVVLGGGVALGQPGFVRQVARAARAGTFSEACAQVVPAMAGDRAGVQGAALLTRDPSLGGWP